MKYTSYIFTLLLLVSLYISTSSSDEVVDDSKTEIQRMSSAPTLSTHILDTSIGRAVANVSVSLYRLESDNSWQKLNEFATNMDGRIVQLIAAEHFKTGVYKLHFDTLGYFKSRNISTFYPYIEIIIECVKGEHYHIPLLLNAFGYSTYRGT